MIFGVQSYWSQLFIIPAKVIKLIEAHCRSFLWSGVNTITRKSLIAWEKVCTPKSVGGLNLISTKLWNKAAIAKVTWDLSSKQDKLWIRWIHAYYIKSNTLISAPIPLQASWMVRKIIAARSILEQTQTMQHTTITIKTIYQKLLGDNQRVSWKALVSDNKARPKAKITLWLQIQDRLQTTDKLHAWGMEIDQQCKLCQQHRIKGSPVCPMLLL